MQRGPAKAASSCSNKQQGRLCRGQSCTKSMPLTSAPCSTRNFTVLKWPLCAHLIRGVSFICGSSQQSQARCDLIRGVNIVVRLCCHRLVWALVNMHLR